MTTDMLTTANIGDLEHIAVQRPECEEKGGNRPANCAYKVGRVQEAKEASIASGTCRGASFANGSYGCLLFYAAF
eukprot:1150032-Pelagomonas_calceolata.AAC.1